jgi:hypothetical protein
LLGMLPVIVSAGSYPDRGRRQSSATERHRSSADGSMRAVASITSLRVGNQTEPVGSQPGRVQASESEGSGCGDPWRPRDLLSRARSADTGAGVGCPPDVGLPI